MFDIYELNIAIEVWGIAFCLIGIVCSLLLVHGNSQYRRLLVVMFSLELLAAAGDAVTMVYAEQTGGLARIVLYAGNFTTFACTFLLQAAITYYLCLRFSEAGRPSYKTWRVGVTIAAVCMCVLTLCGVFYYFDQGNVYHRTTWYYLTILYVVAVSLVNSALVVINRRSLGSTALVCLLFYTIAPLVAAVVQAFIFGPNLAIAVGTMGLVVVFLEMQTHSARTMATQAEELAQSQAEAAESRIVAMVSQIQPHFLFNTLDTIYGLVDEDTELAKESIASFSRYLRTNLASLNKAEPVPIETEMGHVRTYLELERTSDPDRVAYEFDLAATGFKVPALSVQTLVENAVKHGLGGCAEGGTVTVRTREGQGEYMVTIEDNGVGFIVGELAADSNAHIGLANTRSRVAAMCGGSLDVQSSPGVGTRVVVHIPKERL